MKVARRILRTLEIVKVFHYRFRKVSHLLSAELEKSCTCKCREVLDVALRLSSFQVMEEVFT